MDNRFSQEKNGNFFTGGLGPSLSPFLDSSSAPVPSDDDLAPIQIPEDIGAAFIAPEARPDEMPAIPGPAQMVAAGRKTKAMAAPSFSAPEHSHYSKPAFFLCTTAGLEGMRIQSALGVVAVEIVVPKDLLFRNPAPYGDLNRLKAAEDQLARIREKAMEELADKAKALHADGVVGVNLQISSLDAVACLCSATGTAVKLAAA